jgi:hypothetical protein
LKLVDELSTHSAMGSKMSVNHSAMGSEMSVKKNTEREPSPYLEEIIHVPKGWGSESVKNNQCFEHPLLQLKLYTPAKGEVCAFDETGTIVYRGCTGAYEHEKKHYWIRGVSIWRDSVVLLRYTSLYEESERITRLTIATTSENTLVELNDHDTWKSVLPPRVPFSRVTHECADNLVTYWWYPPLHTEPIYRIYFPDPQTKLVRAYRIYFPDPRTKLVRKRFQTLLTPELISTMPSPLIDLVLDFILFSTLSLN